MIILALATVALLLGPQSPAAPGASSQSPPDLPVSIERIRAALERSDALVLRPVIPDITPDFVVNVDERARFEPRAPQWDFRSGPVPPGGLYAYEQLQRAGLSATQPLVVVDLMTIGRAVAAAHAAHAARTAGEDVRRAIAAYCAAQPDDGAAMALCVKR